MRGHLALYEDKTGDETIATIQQKRFHAVPEAAPSLGFTNSVYWIKLVLENDTAKIRTVVLELPNQFLDFVDMFVISDWTSTVERYHGGARVPWADRTSQGRYPLVYLYFAPHEQKTIYVRVQSRTPLRVPLGLWTEEGYSSAALAEYLLLGLFF